MLKTHVMKREIRKSRESLTATVLNGWYIKATCVAWLQARTSSGVKLVTYLESELVTNLKTAVQQRGLISTISTLSRHGASATNEGEGTP